MVPHVLKRDSSHDILLSVYYRDSDTDTDLFYYRDSSHDILLFYYPDYSFDTLLFYYRDCSHVILLSVTYRDSSFDTDLFYYRHSSMSLWLMLLLWFYPCHSALFYDLKAFSAPLYFQNLFFVTYLIQLTNRHTYLKHSRLTELHLCSSWLDTPPGEVINLFIVVFILSCPHQVCRRSLSSLRLSFS